MGRVSSKEKKHILPEMMVLDVVSRYRGSEAIFRKYDEQAGVCICCNALFETLSDVSERYCVDLKRLFIERIGGFYGVWLETETFILTFAVKANQMPIFHRGRFC
jgi:hypothetical protein